MLSSHLVVHVEIMPKLRILFATLVLNMHETPKVVPVTHAFKRFLLMAVIVAGMPNTMEKDRPNGRLVVFSWRF